jgi:hypothetical protein
MSFVIRYLALSAIAFLFIFGTLPIAVSAMYGGNPPAHIGRLLDKQLEVFATVAPIIFSPFNAFASNDKSDKK